MMLVVAFSASISADVQVRSVRHSSKPMNPHQHPVTKMGMMRKERNILLRENSACGRHERVDAAVDDVAGGEEFGPVLKACCAKGEVLQLRIVYLTADALRRPFEPLGNQRVFERISVLHRLTFKNVGTAGVGSLT
jgi:hypothetical protein